MRETVVKTEEFKDLPLGKIPKDWEIVSLKNEINILHGYAFEGEYFADEPPGDVLLVPGNFHRDGGLYFDENNTKYYRGLIPDGTVLEKGELLIVMTDLSPRTLILGRVVLLELPFRVLHNQRIGKIVLKLPNTWDKRFLLLVMNSDRVSRNIISNATGTTVRHTSPDRIIANVVPKPVVEEQSKIADILHSIDSTIAHTSSIIAKLKQMKAGLLHDLLTRGLDENGELRDAIGHPEQFKDSPLGRIPKDWEVDKFEKLAEAIDPQPDHRAPPEVNDGEPYIGVGDFRPDGSIDFNGCRKVSSAAVTKQQQRFSIEPGDIIFGKIGTIGLPKFLTQIGRRYALNANTVLIKPRGCASFVMWLLESNFVEQQIQFETHSTSQPAFGILRIRAMLVPIPKPEEQIRIAAVLDVHDSRIRTEEAYRDKLKLQKQGLMHDLLTGKVRVQDADKFTPASDKV
ncbi:restriction endonuclease subunit S [Microcoleus sp. BR0-C5]|uniref:restriction endonuclease subunit S n=1 Tax=Microcoleus sp. BR0-C5 TaxID=2818713 RepID=UPI002FD21C67